MNHQLTTILALPLALAACGGPSSAPDQPQGNMASNMAMPATPAVKRGTGIGTITAIDPAAGAVTFDHGPVTELGWPAMTMAFSASPKLLDGFAVGDKVAFAFDWNGKAGQLVSLKKQ